jgi:hypothetical protein
MLQSLRAINRNGGPCGSLRSPPSFLDRIKLEANKRFAPYQSLIKTWLAEKVD